MAAAPGQYRSHSYSSRCPVSPSVDTICSNQSSRCHRVTAWKHHRITNHRLDVAVAPGHYRSHSYRLSRCPVSPSGDIIGSQPILQVPSGHRLEAPSNNATSILQMPRGHNRETLSVQHRLPRRQVATTQGHYRIYLYRLSRCPVSPSGDTIGPKIDLPGAIGPPPGSTID